MFTTLMEIVIEIDYREREIIERLESTNLKYKIENLTVGDFILRSGEDVLFVIERKTIKDLCASIIDARFREQKQRLFETTNDASKIVYILEGTKRIKGKGSLVKATIDSAIQNLVFKHHFKVIFSDSIDDTIDQLKMLYKKLTENALEIDHQKIVPVKKSSKIIDNLFVHQLSVIPGISISIAQKINKLYANMLELIEAYQKSDNKQLLLAEILVGPNRRLGKSLSTKVYEYLCKSPGIPEAPENTPEAPEVQDTDVNVKLNCVL